MAIERDDPYTAFNYRLTIQPENGLEIRGGFSEVSGLAVEVTYTEYREGTDPINTSRRIPTQYKGTDITLKRGLLGRLELWQWLKEVREGNQDTRATTTIELLNENRSDTVMTWTLKGTRPSKWSGPQLSAKSTEVAMEELVLVCEDFDIE